MSHYFRPSLGLALACAIASVATAQTSPTGCYTRSYDDAHLAKHPDQVVKSMQILFSPPQGEQTAGGARLRVEMADQGHAARDGFGGQVFDEGLYCAAGDHWYCGIDCDGGTFDVIRSDGETLVIRTSHLRLGESEGCGGTTNLAERPEQTVDYLLRRAALDACPPPY